jgi:hypothetical protein
MRPLACLTALLALTLVVFGCKTSENTRTASAIHRLLLAAASDTSGQLESFAGKLPKDLPVEPPRYPGSQLIVSSRQPSPGSDTGAAATPTGSVPQPTLFLIVYDTGDSREKVFKFYQDALEKDPWQLESSFSTGGLDTLQFSDVSDGDITGAVSISTGGKDGRTSILISLQDAGAFRQEEPPFKPPDSLTTPKEFPDDVPLYPGSITTSSAFLREPGNESFLIIFITTDSQDEIVSFYRDELHKLGWIVQEGAPLGLEDRIDFHDDGSDIQGSLLADRFARDRTYTEVRLQIRMNPARTPGGTVTPAPTTPAAASTPVPTSSPSN